jgi:glycosyltransferase involved in cell wall biosynthesis
LAPNTRFVTGCGHIDPIKGTDLFVEMAGMLGSANDVPLAFIWIGGIADRKYAARVQSSAAKSVIFVGEVEDPSLYFAASEVVVVTSRVESFSRVALEAGALGRPVLAFAAARGPADLLPPECLVTDLSATAMAASISSLLASPASACQLGAALRIRIEEGYLAQPWIDRLLKRIAAMSHD